tara:strand:- start:1858 stop:2370 length:513 start_codon:yes stop_codon:yes gene_type:complete
VSSNLTVPTIPALKAEEIINRFRLERHPEGGWFRRTFESTDRLLLDRGDRFACTSIIYFLAKGEHSSLHALKSDEIWFFHAGSGMVLHCFDDSGYSKFFLGPDFENDQCLELTIRAGTNFSAELRQEGDWSLVSCVVCPGFDYDDFSFSDFSIMRKSFPEHESLLRRLCR